MDNEPDAQDADFAHYMRARQTTMLRFASALCSDGRLAEELVASVLCRAYERWDRISALDRPDAYVRRMIVNEFLSHKRREARLRPVAEIADFPDPFSDHAEKTEARDVLRYRLSALPARQRAALVLRYFENMTDQEIAENIGCAPGTVRSLLSRALATLRVSARDSESDQHESALTAARQR